MEGPSLYLAAEQLQPFAGQTIQKVAGNTRIGKEKLLNLEVKEIFSYGKYLFFQFDTFALRVHFLLWGSFQATIKDKTVTGDYPKKARVPRLALQFDNGHIEMYSCSVKFVEEADARSTCDFSVDIMSPEWDGKAAFKKIKEHEDFEIGDVLLNQTIFMGVGNIIKNEVLLQVHLAPERKVEEISQAKLKQLVKVVRDYVFKFYEWRKQFVLRQHYQVYRQSYCKICGNKIKRKRTGIYKRFSYICDKCEK